MDVKTENLPILQEFVPTGAADQKEKEGGKDNKANSYKSRALGTISYKMYSSLRNVQKSHSENNSEQLRNAIIYFSALKIVNSK